MTTKAFNCKRMNEVKRGDRIIILYGETGTGKSTFINAVAGCDAAKVDHTLKGSANRIEVFKITGPDLKPFVLVEAPGVDTSNNDSSKLGLWLHDQKNPPVAGVIYLRRITDNRMSNAQINTLDSLSTICGIDAASHIFVLTTMWDVPATARQIEREREFKTDFCSIKAALGECKLLRMENTKKQTTREITRAARQTVQEVLDRDPCRLLVGRQMRDSKGDYRGTAVGKVEEKSKGFRGFFRGLFSK
ncbi:SubName: Full=Uncharacterized protein {ECO:0000313/EMBL:CCA72590.1} [Serendipita indica DSM 11827]|uniref:G domain-containing protein n=1 Tax=Serendipita indica (strain DSM 11827) TaxID=1109443 RepID=G4TMP8_SERID|nr:SubName: Full=Uncharacterized protein {ECO:0000313/EMBL:CCA72590.1} [Serendipita indica DSM 11827]CCA72590.1 hypothetical protein PIIN_06527 [Serendipita indica DSM 11827]